MERHIIIEKLLEIIEDVSEIPRDSIPTDVSILDELDLSSFEIFMTIGAVEDFFSIRIPEQCMRTIVTVDDLADIIEELLA